MFLLYKRMDGWPVDCFFFVCVFQRKVMDLRWPGNSPDQDPLQGPGFGRGLSLSVGENGNKVGDVGGLVGW